MNSTDSSLEYQKDQINVYYVTAELIVAVFAVIGNALVIFVFQKERRLRRRTNYYIVSLAAADFLVGLLGIPFAIMSSIGLPNNLHACLFTVSLLVVLCTISIFCLVAVSVDRYWAILHPMGYSRNVRTKTAIVIISICWIAGTIVGFLPLMGWHNHNTSSNVQCFFLDVVNYDYLVFLYFGTIITPALLLAAFYTHIYQVVLKQLRRIVTMNPDSSASSSTCSSGGTMIRMLGAAQKREVKATQNLAIIVLFFMICWIPLYTINCVIAFCDTCQVDPTFMLSCIILSHLNSAGNPILYAYHLRDFRSALKNFFCNLFGHGDINRTNSHQVFNRKLNSYSHRSQYKGNYQRTNSQIHYRKKSTEQIKNPVVIPITDPGREIWNIPEGSDSSNSFKQLNENVSVVRPVTPCRSNDISQVNLAYIESCTMNGESDDVFMENDFSLPEFPFDDLEANLTKKNDSVKTVAASKALNFSPSLNQNLFFIQTEFRETKRRFQNGCERSISVDNSDLKKFNTFNNRMEDVLHNKKKLERSLSDEGARFSQPSLPKPNGIIKTSCGS